MESGAAIQRGGASRVRRGFAVLLSLVVPGAGHFLLGRFRRGVAWALAVAVLGEVALFTMPVSVWVFAIAITVVLAGRVGGTGRYYICVGGRWAARFVH